MYINENQQLREFLSSHEAATLAVPIDNQGTIHAASLLYAHETNPLRFFFVTAKSTEKYTLLRMRESIAAALVIGTEKGTPFTIQLRGTLQTLKPADNTLIIEQYYRKRGNRGDDINDPTNCLLVFTPDWGRFTDYATGYDQYHLDLQ